MWGTSPSTTTFSSRAVVVDDIALEEPADGGTLDEECVVLDEDGRFDAYKEVWQPFDEEKRLDLRRHARIAGAETARDALQGLEASRASSTSRTATTTPPSTWATTSWARAGWTTSRA